MAHKIQIRRGLKKDLPLLDSGEIGFAQDTEEIFVGGSNGNVDLTSKGKINELASELAQISPDDTFDNSHFISNMVSYIGVENKTMPDGTTRFYLLPRVSATTGLGAGLKIFADPYHKQNETNYDYRDLGIYFHGAQNGDTGVNGTGVFWINGKVLGPSFLGKNPDIGFSFQDGAVRAGRFIYTDKSGAGNAVLVLGHSIEGFQTTRQDIKLALDGGIGFNDNSKAYIIWKDGAGVAGHKLSFNPSDFTLTFGGAVALQQTASSLKVNKALVSGTKLINNAAVTTLDVTGYNRVKMGVGTAHTISNFTGVDGQQIRILFAMNTTTIENNANIKLKGGVNFTGSPNDILVLENWDGIWQEVSRSPNHA